jgi:hypothetical protein
MNYRTIFWVVGFALPVATAIAILVQLQHERASVEAMIARLAASSQQAELALQKDINQQQVNEHAENAGEAEPGKQRGLLSWDKRFAAAMSTATRLATEGRPAIKDSLGLLDQPSATQLYFPQLLGDPAYHNAVSALVKQQLEEKYGYFFPALALSPADQDQLENLLTQQQMAREDAKSMVNNGPNQPAAQAEVSAASSDTINAINAEIQAKFGPQVTNAISAYNGIAQFYKAADKMEARLSYTLTPLQPGQADQIVGLLVQALGSKVYNSYWPVPANVITQAASVLSPPQVAALKQIQQEQAARIQTRSVRPPTGGNP